MRRKTRFVLQAIFILLVALYSSRLLAVELQRSVLSSEERFKTFQKGAVAYEEGRFEEAVEAFNGVLYGGFENADVYYNLGNAYHRLGKPGQAIAAYLKGMRLRPRDSDLRFNLSFLRKQTNDKIETSSLELWRQLAFFWTELLTLKEMMCALVVVNGVFWCLVFWRLKKKAPWQMWSLMINGSFLVLLVLAVSSRALLATPLGVVTDAELPVRSGPSPGHTELFLLHEGSEFRILSQEDDWLHLKLADSKEGWVRATSVEMIKP